MAQTRTALFPTGAQRQPASVLDPRTSLWFCRSSFGRSRGRLSRVSTYCAATGTTLAECSLQNRYRHVFQPRSAWRSVAIAGLSEVIPVDRPGLAATTFRCGRCNVNRAVATAWQSVCCVRLVGESGSAAKSPCCGSISHYQDDAMIFQG